MCLGVATIGLYGQSRKAHGGAGLVAPWEGGRDKYHDEPIIVIGGASNVGQNGAYTRVIPIHVSN